MTARARCSCAPTDDAERPLAEVDRGHVVGDVLGAEALGLLADPHHQLRAEHALGEAGVVLDVGGDHQLAAGLKTLDTERVQIRARGVDGGCQSCTGAADDDQVTDVVAHGPERRTSLPASPAPEARGRPDQAAQRPARKSLGTRNQPASA